MKITKEVIGIGKSLGLILPSEICKNIGIKKGDNVLIDVVVLQSGNCITIEKATEVLK